jgi:hypothetical protein
MISQSQWSTSHQEGCAGLKPKMQTRTPHTGLGLYKYYYMYYAIRLIERRSD